MRLLNPYLFATMTAALAVHAAPPEDLLSEDNLLLTSTVMMHFADSAMAKKEYARVKAFALAQSALNAKMGAEDTAKIAAFYAERLKAVAAAEAKNPLFTHNPFPGPPGGVGHGGTFMPPPFHLPPLSDTAYVKKGVGAGGKAHFPHSEKNLSSP